MITKQTMVMILIAIGLTCSLKAQIFDGDTPEALEPFEADGQRPDVFSVAGGGLITEGGPGFHTGRTGVSQYTDPLGAVVIDTGDYLVAWRTPGGAVLERWQRQGASLGLTESTSRALVGVTPYMLVDMLYDPVFDALYWTDDDRDVVEVATLNPAGSIASLVWTTLADVTTAPLLGIGPRYFDWLPDQNLPSVRHLFVGELKGDQTRWASVLVGAPGPVSVVELNLYASMAALSQRQPHIDWLNTSEGDMEVPIRGQSGDVVEIVKTLTSTVIGTATISAGQTAAIASVSEALEIGQWYGARFSGSSQVASNARCIARYNNTMLSLSGLGFRPVSEPIGLALGNLNFVFTTYLDQHPAPPSMYAIQSMAIAGLAARGPGGVDPIIALNPGYILDPNRAVLLPVHGYVDASGHGVIRLPLPIPNDPLLTGHVALIQTAIDDGTGLILSDIIGVLLGS